MEIKTDVKISKEELVEIIKEKYQIDGEISFIIKEDTFKCGVNDEGNIYSKRYIFDGVKIINSNQK